MLVETNGTNDIKYEIAGSNVRVSYIPETAPNLDDSTSTASTYNSDNTVCTTYEFKLNIFNVNGDLDRQDDWIEYVSNLKLKRYKRQSNTFIFPEAKSLILGKETEDRSFALAIKSDLGQLSYSVGNPQIDFTNNLLILDDSLEIKSLYVSYWKYVGQTVTQDYLEHKVPARYLDYLNLRIGPSTAKTTLKLDALTDTVYILPDNKEDLDYNANTYIVTSTRLNDFINNLGIIDQGEYW